VEFPDYCGPHWIQDKLAYAKTGHTFQGQSEGPEHAIPCIIIQPGTLKMECLCPGLLYMFISCGTMIGTPEDRSSSAIFFTTD
jgi:hypothetical protein